VVLSPLALEHRPLTESGPANPRLLRRLSVATVATIGIALGLVFFYAPLDADQGFVQKIFYIHVPLAIVSLCGFILGGVLAVVQLRTGDRKWDMRSYVAIHMALIFGIAGLITGSISIEDPERQARYASVFAIVAGAFVPLNFIAVRLAQQYVHPRVLTLGGGNLPGPMRLTFIVSLVGIALLYATLMTFEITAKTTRMQVRRLRRQMLGDPGVRPVRRSAAPS
jgi:heme exporter protein C